MGPGVGPPGAQPRARLLRPDVGEPIPYALRSLASSYRPHQLRVLSARVLRHPGSLRQHQEARVPPTGDSWILEFLNSCLLAPIRY